MCGWRKSVELGCIIASTCTRNYLHVVGALSGHVVYEYTKGSEASERREEWWHLSKKSLRIVGQEDEAFKLTGRVIICVLPVNDLRHE